MIDFAKLYGRIFDLHRDEIYVMLLEEGRREHNMSAYGCCVRKTTGENIGCIPFIPAKRRTLCDMGHVTGYSKSRLKKKRKRLAQLGLLREAGPARNQSSFVSREKKTLEKSQKSSQMFQFSSRSSVVLRSAALHWWHFVGGTQFSGFRIMHTMPKAFLKGKR